MTGLTKRSPCVHCGRPLGDGVLYEYWRSRRVAHIRCVSQPSVDAMDALLCSRRSSPR